MPIVLKTGTMKYRKEDGTYGEFNALTEQFTDEQIQAVQTAAAQQISAIQQKGQQTRDSVPDDYTALADQVSDLKSATNELFTTSSNMVIDDVSFWNQGNMGGTQPYAIHSERIDITNHDILYFGGICTGTLLTSNNYFRVRYYDSSDNLLYNGGSVILSDAWVNKSSTALIDYPSTSYIIVESSTNNASVHVTPETFVENYKLYVGYDKVTSFDDWVDHYVPKVDVLEARIDNLEERVTELENEIPSYWSAHINDKIATIRTLDGKIGTHGVSFVFITDVHWQNNFQNAPALINKILENTSVKMVVCGGDILTKNSSIDSAMDVINEWATETNKLGTFNVYGNHDNNSNSGNDSALWIGYDRWYGALLKPVENNVVWSSDKKYYYVDNAAQNVRMIFLNTGYDQGTGLDNTQAGWLQQLLYDLESGWTAIVFTHLFFLPATVESGVTTLSLLGSGTLAKRMIDSQYSNMEAHGAHFACVVTGHVHRDYALETENGYPIIGTTCDANGLQASLYDPVNTVRTAGTTTEQAFDVYHVDTENKKIYVTRIGAGTDREFDY